MQTKHFFKTLLLFSIILFFSNCEKDEAIFEDPLLIENNSESTSPKAVYGDRNIWFSNWASGTYWYNRMVADFGNVYGLSNPERDRQTVQNSNLKVKLLKDELTGYGGITAYVNLDEADEYTLEYKVKFEDGFQWKAGGKIPGLAGGTANTGCNKATGDGWSFRVMWRNFFTENGNQPYLEPYVYHAGMPGNCGDNFNSDNNDNIRYTITTNQWYTIFIRVKMNTGANSDGVLEMKVNGTTVYNNTSFKWVTQNSGRNINRILWSIYRGGSSDNYKASEDNYILLDNVKINKI